METNFFMLTSSNLSIQKKPKLQRSKKVLRNKRNKCPERMGASRAADDRLSSDGGHVPSRTQGYRTGCSQPSQDTRVLCSPACAMEPGEEQLPNAGWAVEVTDTTFTDSPGCVVPKALKMHSGINVDGIS